MYGVCCDVVTLFFCHARLNSLVSVPLLHVVERCLCFELPCKQTPQYGYPQAPLGVVGLGGFVLLLPPVRK